MDKYFEALLSKYNEQIIVGIVPYADIVENLRSQFNVFEYSEKDIPHFEMHLFNAVNLPSNEILGLDESQLEIKCIGILVDEKSLPYTKKDYTPYETEDGVSVIYLAYEDNVGYHRSNSNRLFLETEFAHGISSASYYGKTEELMSLLKHMECYKEYV